ncbi:Protein CBG27060 [Caenorhabditis briggsae]|uniref:Protein CBG27060 n=1 Tax=Caenorhabditis briggsae TaxID=6238 RepID=B6IMC4_CAEBR|nr:Protein CBG27060 [Caenorhabditis briggsae]CAS01054.1 Protein CBG27060 [Caenorhabditis briggsae]
MRFLYSLLFVLLVAASSMAIISQDQRSGIVRVDTTCSLSRKVPLQNGYAQKTALVDVPGEIQPEGVTGQPRFVKQTVG